MKTHRTPFILAAAAFILPALVSTATGATLYVNTDGIGGDYTSIQDAINAATEGDEIIVAQGTYYENIVINFINVNLMAPDGATIDGGGSGTVVTCENVTSDTVLDGFTITNGYSNAGGGMYNDIASLTVTNCTFSDNSAYRQGGGMFNLHSSPTVTNCTFSGNYTVSGGDVRFGGGGMYNLNSSPTVANCTFSGNSTTREGGGMKNFYSSPTVANCTFSNNTADYGGGMANFGASPSPIVTNCTFSGNSTAAGGGGMVNVESSPAVTNCMFSGNSASGGGGMMSSGTASSPTVTNCMFSDNTASFGGGMVNIDNASPTTVTNCTFCGNSATTGSGGMHNEYNFNNEYGCATVTNSIFWGNSPSQLIGKVTVSYSDVLDGLPGGVTDGGNNINANPLFGSGLTLTYASPCRDTGDNSAVTTDTDLAGNMRIAGYAVDMGAFEYQTVSDPPAEQLQDLGDFIQASVVSGQVDAELGISLMDKVNAALDALARNDKNSAKTTMNDLQALVNQVEAQAGHKIDTETAQQIIANAQQIIAAMGG